MHWSTRVSKKQTFTKWTLNSKLSFIYMWSIRLLDDSLTKAFISIPVSKWVIIATGNKDYIVLVVVRFQIRRLLLLLLNRSLLVRKVLRWHGHRQLWSLFKFQIISRSDDVFLFGFTSLCKCYGRGVILSKEKQHEHKLFTMRKKVSTNLMPSNGIERKFWQMEFSFYPRER